MIPENLNQEGEQKEQPHQGFQETQAATTSGKKPPVLAMTHHQGTNPTRNVEQALFKNAQADR
jgi:hypothetical protein